MPVAALMSVALSASFSSCSERQELSGAWVGVSTRIDGLANVSRADYVPTIDFGTPDQATKEGGPVSISATIDVAQAVSSADPAARLQPYEVSVAATASMTGRYVFKEHSGDDDIIVSLDPSSLKVFVDPSGVAFNADMLSGRQKPEIDSLTAVTAQAWTRELTAAMQREFAKYAKIDDIKIHHDDIMSCEVADRDLTFRRPYSQD